MEKKLELEALAGEFSVCRLADGTAAEVGAPFTFLSYTDEELSLVCPAGKVPAACTHREDGWRGFRIRGGVGLRVDGYPCGDSRCTGGGKNRDICCFHLQYRLYFCKRQQLFGGAECAYPGGLCLCIEIPRQAAGKFCEYTHCYSDRNVV